MKSKKIYFSGSIRGGRDDAFLYQKAICLLKEKHRVLTEHIGNLDLQETLSDEGIYQRDVDYLKECDLVIGECTTPSLGVGYELAYAESLRKDVHILYNRKRESLSAMLLGNPYFHIHPYADEEEFLRILETLSLSYFQD